MSETKIKIENNGESVLIYENGKEIVGWHQDEWNEDPSIVPAIVNAVYLALTNMNKLKRLVKLHK